MILKIKNWILKNRWWTALIAVILIVVLYFLFFSNSGKESLEGVSVERRSIKEVVSTTGNVKPLSDVNLSFEKTGRVSNMAVSVGDRVYKWQYLASVSNADLVAQVDQAKAGVKSAQANLDSLLKGSTVEQVAIQESQVEKAQVDLAESEKSLLDTIVDSYNKSDDAIRNKIDQMFTNPRTSVAQLEFNINNFQLKNDINSGRVSIEEILVFWNNSILNSSISLNDKYNTAKSSLDAMNSFLDKMALAVNSLEVEGSSLTQTTIDAWRLAVSTSRTNVGLAISSLSSSISRQKTALSSLKIAENQLASTESKATPEEIASKEALVEQAQASLDNANAQLAKSIIVSPIEGVITKIDTKIGEIIQPGITAISVISYGDYEVEAYIAEADIAKVKIGDMASTTLDAYGSDTFFDTAVIKIDPAETVIAGVSTYKVTSKFVFQDERIRSGMTANLDILTGQKDGVLALPSRTVYTSDGKKFVSVIDPQDPKKTTEKEVKTGLKGIDGFIEIISGIEEGEKVVASPSR